MKWIPTFSSLSSTTYMVLGIWPLLDLKGFRLFTHSNSSEFLLLAAGGLLALVGLLSLLSVSYSPLELGLLGMASVMGLAGLDLRELFSGGMQGVLILHSLTELVQTSRE